MNGNILIYALVAVAAGSVGYLLWQMVAMTGDATSARFDLESSAYADGRQKKPIERFVAPGTLFRMRLTLAVLAGLLAPGLFLTGGFANVFLLVGFSLGLGFAGWQAPLLYYRRLVRKRQLRFEERILDLTVGLGNALRAGMALAQAVDRLTEQMSGPMREELEIMRAEYRLGTDIAQSFERLTERMPCEDMQLLTASVRLTTQTGGSLADVLEEMTATIRARRKFQDMLTNMTEKGRIEGWGLGAMPFVAFGVFYYIQPEIMKNLFTTETGWMALGLAALLETVGFIVIGKVTKVEV